MPETSPATKQSPQNDSTIPTPTGVSPLEARAIQAALDADWEQAITLNKQIIKENQAALEANNRLGRAYSETGQIDKAKSSYREVLKHDPYNSIALKNLERLKAANGSKAKMTGSTALSPDLFMEEPGKTKVLELTNLTKAETLALLHTGDIIKMDTIGSNIVFTDASGTKLGSYSGEHADKLASFLKGGNVYEAYVKSVKPTMLRVFVREVKRVPKFENTPSFPANANGFKPYVHESAIELTDTEVETEHVDTTATEAEVAKKIASVETLAEEETSEETPLEEE